MECASPSSHYKTRKILKSKADTDSTREDLTASDARSHTRLEVSMALHTARQELKENSTQTSLDAEIRAIKSNTVEFKPLRRAKPFLPRERDGFSRMGLESTWLPMPRLQRQRPPQPTNCRSSKNPLCDKLLTHLWGRESHSGAGSSCHLPWLSLSCLSFFLEAFLGET